MTLADHTTDSAALPQAPRHGWPVRILLILICAVLAAMWVYYFVFASDKGVYQLQDTSWREQASPICVAAQAERAELTDTAGGYIQNPTPEQMLQRADIVDQATDIIEQMLNDIVAIPVDNDDDRLRLATFEENFRIVIADRRRYSATLRELKVQPYNETIVGGGPVSNVVLDFTAGVKGNDVPECSPPGELGGDLQP
ncbi:MAG: hypothetical protein K8R99_14055 [Actinomycetia bacterium]|nr:hypothetical protein [Actinomycetes bacterium]